MNNQQNMQTGSGLTRYRSAPSSYFDTLLSSPINEGGDGFGLENDLEQIFNPRAFSPETQRIFSKFVNSGSDTIQETNQPQQINSQFLPPVKKEPDQLQQQQQPQQHLQRQQSNQYSSASQMMYQSNQGRSVEATSSGAVDNGYDRMLGSFNANRGAYTKMEDGSGSGGGGGGSSLIRHSSSPAGLFANINVENEFGALRSAIGNFGGGNNSANAEASFTSSSRFNPSNQQFNQERGNEGNYVPNFPMNSWDDSSSVLSDNYLKGPTEDADKSFSNANYSDYQNDKGEETRPTTLLSHHLSLPKAAMEKLLQDSDSVPCRIRAKRGFATHPRSIAERVRRTKISDRMRKLQELVPNMERQTNTSDMLDFAVDYIKDLQKQLKTLSDNRTTCTCSGKHRS